MSEWIPFLAQIAAAIVAGGAGWFLVRAQRGKTRADAASAIEEAAGRMVARWERRVESLEGQIEDLEAEVEKLRAQVKALTGRVRVLERENRELREGALKLESQIVGLGHQPVWSVRRLGEVKDGDSPGRGGARGTEQAGDGGP